MYHGRLIDPKYKIDDEVYFILDMTEGGEKIIHKGIIFCVFVKKDFKGGFIYSYSIKNATQFVTQDEQYLFANFGSALALVQKEENDGEEAQG